ncbi:hypothetical protein AMTR_s00037p00184990 [Amborella trichopoda]|uniref:Uncharacterized protein n=1 Tax=Amborella trichopoda TaxID=13333 RepID=U5DAF5_AMBTC|nr:hypothetical protein AMTR_s00037p00184990 [Amborella trichopoda]
MLQVLLAFLGKVYPLQYWRAARKSRSRPRSLFVPLALDPLAIVVIEEAEEQLALEEGVFVPEAGLEGGLGEGGLDQEPGLALVEIDIPTPPPPPLNFIHQENMPLLLHLVIENPRIPSPEDSPGQVNLRGCRAR